jgi:hypothetical protein
LAIGAIRSNSPPGAFVVSNPTEAPARRPPAVTVPPRFASSTATSSFENSAAPPTFNASVAFDPVVMFAFVQFAAFPP